MYGATACHASCWELYTHPSSFVQSMYAQYKPSIALGTTGGTEISLSTAVATTFRSRIGTLRPGW